MNEFFPDPRAADLFANGLTRTAVRARHALLTPDGLRVVSRAPGWDAAAQVVVAISPAMGARSFSQWHVGLPAGATGEVGSARDPRQRFLYVVAGEVALTLKGETTQRLATGGFGYVPAQGSYRVEGVAAESRLVIFEKQYWPLFDGNPTPAAHFGHVDQCPTAPFLGDPDAMLTTLLPDEPGFDMAVNVFRFTAGAALPFVETHVMEHGLFMLSGRGIYRLEDAWYPVRAGDAIWMAPFCPQWFGALGREGAAYLYYKDVNRTA